MSDNTEVEYDTAKILGALPHRYPMLLVDRVASLAEEEIHAVKAVSFNEDFFQGHFPGRPIMPGVLQIEALAQAAGILAIESLGLAGTGKLVYFMADRGCEVPQSGHAGPFARSACGLRPEALARLQVLGQGLDRRQGDVRGELHRDDRRQLIYAVV